MTLNEAIQILITYNQWRRGADMEQPHPKEIGIAIDTAIRLLQQLTHADDHIDH